MAVIIVWSLIAEEPTYMAVDSGKLHQMSALARYAIFKRHKYFGNMFPIPVVSQHPPRTFGVTCQSAGRLGRSSRSFPAMMMSQAMSAGSTGTK